MIGPKFNTSLGIPGYAPDTMIYTYTSGFPTFKYNKRDFFIYMKMYLDGNKEEFMTLNNIMRIRWNI